jgi:hypothetical protein
VCLFAAARSSRRYGDPAGTNWAVAKSAAVKAKMRTLLDSARRSREGDAKQVNAE